MILERKRGSLLAAIALAACADFKNAPEGDASTDAAAESALPGSDAGGDSPRSLDGSGVDGARDGAGLDGGTGDGGASDTGSDVRADAQDSGLGPTGLDPGVTLPDLSEPTCTDPGNSTVCGGVRACRMATPDSGRCDDCNPASLCNGLVKTFCSQSLDCDVNLQCFRGRCTLFCTLPNGAECGGAPGTCLNVGHDRKGLCDPARL